MAVVLGEGGKVGKGCRCMCMRVRGVRACARGAGLVKGIWGKGCWEGVGGRGGVRKDGVLGG